MAEVAAEVAEGQAGEGIEEGEVGGAAEEGDVEGARAWGQATRQTCSRMSGYKGCT